MQQRIKLEDIIVNEDDVIRVKTALIQIKPLKDTNDKWEVANKINEIITLLNSIKFHVNVDSPDYEKLKELGLIVERGN